MSISPSFEPDYMSDPMTAVSRFGGLTLRRSFETLLQHPNIPIVTLGDWNTWGATRFCAWDDTITCNGGHQTFENGAMVFVDAYNADFSRDLEPGGLYGDSAYQELKGLISDYRAGTLRAELIATSDGTLRAAAAQFNEQDYLTMYPDVAALVGSHVFTSGYAHYRAFGVGEGRSPNLLFSEKAYREANPEVATLVKYQHVASGFDHFVSTGNADGRAFIPVFDEHAYLVANPDVKAAVLNHSLPNGLFHYVRYGQKEHRAVSMLPGNLRAVSPAAASVSPKAYGLGSGQAGELHPNWPPSAAVDGNPATAYSSNAHTSATDVQNVWLAQWMDGQHPVSSIVLNARMASGKPLAFPKSYDIYLTNVTNQSWVLAGHFTAQPDASGVVNIVLDKTYYTYGILIRPTVMTTDDSLVSYYFQLVEVKLLGSNLNFVPPPAALAFNMRPAGSNDAFWPATNATDGVLQTAYSSNRFASSTNDRGVYLAAGIWDGVDVIAKLSLTARMQNGVALGFPKAYDVLVLDKTGSNWVRLGNFTTQPDATGVANVQLPTAYLTNGIMISPTVLGKDDFGSYYFQIAEIRLWNN